ncbi:MULTISPECIES: hypothetical protein [unclassified Streptomyces]|uniref:hypothetical protein n=1 Tax=unclassified Streptomyces TaxID=2593676 RepID=UPI002E13A5AE|nr:MULTISPECIES: hypothetical protein [unclassified Streptomyces]WSR23528.1 hypothetical protein OG573_33490 [Streptomyces sp. NBC_01205]
MDRSVPPAMQGTGADALDSTLFLPGRSAVDYGMTKGGGEKRSRLVDQMALMPQFLEPLGLRVVDDVDETPDDEH